MQQEPGLGQRGPLVRPLPRAPRRRVPRAPTPLEIPYDYVAVFDLTGRRGNRVEQVISISVEGAFVVTSIGYSFLPARLPDRAVELGELENAAGGLPEPFQTLLLDLFQDPRMLAQCLLARLCGVDFLYSIIDSATGRELQNRSIHNVAGLGDPFGKRPFRPMPKPMMFLPRSTIRVVVEEVSEGPIYGYDNPGNGQRVTSQLFIALHGYKLLGQVL
jgi:hypothetical protein